MLVSVVIRPWRTVIINHMNYWIQAKHVSSRPTTRSSLSEGATKRHTLIPTSD